MTLGRIVWTVLLLLPGAALAALGLYMYQGEAELSHAYGGMTIAIGILVLLAGICFALPRQRRLTPRQR